MERIPIAVMYIEKHYSALQPTVLSSDYQNMFVKCTFYLTTYKEQTLFTEECEHEMNNKHNSYSKGFYVQYAGNHLSIRL